ncbi:monocyte chemotactic protein 1B-like [Centroberyx affinis]|uniref:monocyte chemotactic protein 1B-like n=1 Tax=Centroberyx affinis TaxID=166261 RepID=UPI003A5C1846
MAPWCDAKLFFCILFFSWCCTVTVAEIPRDCCLMVGDVPVDKKFVINYQRQISGQGCSLDAVIFETRKGRHICAAANSQWVGKLMTHVNKLKKHCEKMKYKGKRCEGVQPK